MRQRGPVIVLVSLLLLILLVGGGFLYLRTRTARTQVRAFVEQALARELDLPVRLGGFSLSLGLGSVELRNLAITDRNTGAPLLDVDRVRIRLAVAALLTGDLRVTSVTVRGPRLSVEDTPPVRESLRSVVARFMELSRDREIAGFPIRVEQGAVTYRNPTTGVGARVGGLSGRLSWPTPDRPVTIVMAEAMEVRIGSRGLSGVRLEAQARLGREVVEVERLRLDRGGSGLAFTGVVLNPRGSPRVELTMTGELVLDELAPALGGGQGWSGKLLLGGKLFGEGVPRNFEGRLGLADGTVAGIPARLVTATVLLRPDRVDVVSLTAQAGGGTLSAAGVFEPEDARWRGSAQLTDVHLKDLFQVSGRPPILAGRVTGRVEGSGEAAHVARLDLRLNLSGRDLRLPEEERRAEGQLVGSLRNSLFRVERFSLTRGSSRVEARGTVDLGTEALALTASGTVADLGKDLWPWEAKGLAGRLSVSGRLGRTLKQPLFRGQVTVRNASFRGWRADLVEGPVEVEPVRIASRALRVGAAATAATLGGEARLAEPGWGRWRENLHVALKVDLKGRIEDLAARARTAWPVAGPVVLVARLGGRLSALEGGGQLEMRELRIGGERLEALRATLVFQGAALTVPRLTARRGGVPLQAEGALDVEGRYRFSLLPVGLDLRTLPGLTALDPRGTLVLRLWGSGQWQEPRVEGELTLADGVFRDIDVGSGNARFALVGREWRWDLNLALGVRARGMVPLLLSGPFRAEVTAADLDLTPFLRALRARLPFPLVARADGRATLRGAFPGLGDLAGQIELAGLRGQAGVVPWRSREPARLALEGGTLRFESLDLVGPGLSVAIRGSVRPGERTDLDLSGHAPPAIVRPWVPPLADLRGTPEVRLSLAGPPGDLRVRGRAEISDVDLKVSAIPIWMSVRRGEARFDNDGVQYKILEGAAAGGRLEGQGTARREGEQWRHTVDFRLDKAQLEPLYEQLQWERRWASGDLSTHGSVAFDTTPGQRALATLRGRVSVALRGGSLARYPALVRIFGLLGSPAQPFRLPDLTRERMPYRQISADFTVQDGFMETKNLLLDSEVVRVSGVGRVALVDRSVDLDLAVRPLQVLEQGIRKIPLLGRLLPQEQSLIVTYFDMQGAWADPDITVAPIKSLSQTVVDILLLLIRAPERVISPGR